MTRSAPSFSRRSIRFSRTVGLARAIAIGSNIALGLGVFVLGDLLLQRVGSATPQAYFGFLLLALPIVLLYVERGAVLPGNGGAFALVRSSGSTLRLYLTGWLLLGGYLSLIALLGWGAAIYAAGIQQRLFETSIDVRLLGPMIVLLVALNDLIGTRGGWRLRVGIAYSTIAILSGLVMKAWFSTSAPLTPSLTAEPPPAVLFEGIALLMTVLWGVLLVLDRRDEIWTPERRLLPAVLVPVVIGSVLGGLIAAIALPVMGFNTTATAPLAELTLLSRIAEMPLFEILLFSMGLATCLLVLDRTMVTLLRLTGAMVQDGFFPQQFIHIAPGLGTPLFALRVFAVLSALVAAFLPTPILTGFVALNFLWTTLLVAAPDIVQTQPRLPENRRLILPLHPLFPALVALICILLSLVFPSYVLLLGAAWLVPGLIYYVTYAYRGGNPIRRRERVVNNTTLDQSALGTYTVLAGIANPDTAIAIIRAGAALAQARRGRLLVLTVVTFPDQVPQYIQQQRAQSTLETLAHLVEQTAIQGVNVEVLVRLAHDPVDGILATAREERADRIVLGWRNEHVSARGELDPLLDPVVRNATCEVVILRGELPNPVQQALVPTVASRNSMAALRLARDLVPHNTGSIKALNLVQEVFSPTTMDEQRSRLEQLIESTDGVAPIDLEVTATDDVAESILQQEPNFDILVLGASRGGVLDQTIFGGTPVEVSRRAQRPTLMVKNREKARQFWERRAWEMVSAPFPQLPQSERAAIYQQVRQSAYPGIDFFIMIGLSAVIAVLGLLQNSPAVIIGAMLVAPLMSPIVAIGISIVHGDPRLLREAATTTLLGILLAVGVGTVSTLLMPTLIITNEILARTSPNLLDLTVALASGAAAGYAIARKEVAAALPGVAIAAALVPPLGVVGYGLATVQFTIAGGALLLFTTNLVAIIIAASIVFLLLGFRPERSSVRQLVQIKFLLSLLALVVISVPLGIITVINFNEINLRNEIVAVLRDAENDTTQITNLDVNSRGGVFVVSMTVYTLDAEMINQGHIDAMEAEASREVGAPVQIDATVLQAYILPNHTTPTPTESP